MKMHLQNFQRPISNFLWLDLEQPQKKTIRENPLREILREIINKAGVSATHRLCWAGIGGWVGFGPPVYLVVVVETNIRL